MATEAAYIMREAVEADFGNIIDFLNENFVPGEPINKAINLCEPGYRMPYFDRWLEEKLRHAGTITFLAESAVSPTAGITEDPSKLLAVGFSIRHGKADTEASGEHQLTPASSARSDQVPARFRAVLTFLDWMEKAAGPLLAAAPERVEFAMLSGRLDIRVPGLGSALAAKVVATARERGVRFQSVITTSAFSARIFEKLGFKEIIAVPFSDYKVDGKVVFATEEPHTHAKLLVLEEE